MTIHTSLTLSNGVEMPLLGLGVFKAPEGSIARQAVLWALETGYRHIDTAAVYGNESSVGEGLTLSGLERKDYFITTKLWNEDMRQGRQEAAFNNSLKRLKLDYVDLYLIHWPVPGKYEESWKILEKLYKAKKIRAIGVSNFHRHHLENLEKTAEIMPMVNQVECHPLLNQQDLFEYCHSKNMALTAWSPLGGQGSGLLANPVLKEIAEHYGKSTAQVILRWDLQRGIISIPKSVHKERIQQNADIFDFELSSSDMTIINNMNKNQRLGADPDNFNF